MLTGENGIIMQAQVAKENTRGGEVQDRVNLAINENKTIKYAGGTKNTKRALIAKLKEEGKLTEEEINKLLGQNGQTETDIIKIGDIEIDFSGLKQEIKMRVSELKEGDYVKYTDKNGKEIICVVLYDNTSGYGVQAVAMKTVEDVTLGGDDLDTVKDSYNNAIKILNDKSQDYLNEIYATSVRCVGSVPNNPYSENSEPYETSYSGFLDYSGLFENGDENYITDIEKLSILDLYQIDKSYWLASRVLDEEISSVIAFGTGVLWGGMEFDYLGFMFITGSLGDNVYQKFTQGLRPVFTLKAEVGIISGEGTESLPYIFE